MGYVEVFSTNLKDQGVYSNGKDYIKVYIVPVRSAVQMWTSHFIHSQHSDNLPKVRR